MWLSWMRIGRHQEEFPVVRADSQLKCCPSFLNFLHPNWLWCAACRKRWVWLWASASGLALDTLWRKLSNKISKFVTYLESWRDWKSHQAEKWVPNFTIFSYTFKFHYCHNLRLLHCAVANNMAISIAFSCSRGQTSNILGSCAIQ